jgi:glycosyltransferase involved in cell wall biosynthesis
LPEPTPSTLSVILPNYNHGRLLGRALDAFLRQEKAPDEIIIVDDGSTDDSRRILEEIKSRSPTVRVFFNDTNKGVIYSLNRGLEASSGKYVHLAAADDWILPGFFASALAMLERHPQAALACGEVNLITGKGGARAGVRPIIRPSLKATYFSPHAVAALLRRSDNWIFTGAAILSRESVREAGGLLPELGSFADGFLVRKLAVTHGFCYIPKRVAMWEIFEDSVSRRTASDPAKARRTLSSAVAQINADPCFPSWYGELFSRRWMFGVSRLAVIANPINNAALSEMGVRDAIDRFVVSGISKWKLWGLQRPLLLAWLWLRFRPLSPILLFSSLLSRQLERVRRPQ